MLSVQWGAWANVGMASSERMAQVLLSNGLSVLSKEDGWDALELCRHCSQVPVIAVIPVAWHTFLAMRNETSSFFREVGASRSDETDASDNQPMLQVPNPQLTHDALRSFILAKLVESGGEVADAGSEFTDLLDSLGSIQFQNSLSAEFLGMDLPATVLFDHPTVDALEAYLKSVLTLASPPQLSLNKDARETDFGSIYIAGQGCHLSRLQTKTPNFFSALVNGQCFVSRDSPARYATLCQAANIPLDFQCGAYLASVGVFDCAFFGIESHEAQQMDPHSRILCEVIAAALWDSGQRGRAKPQSRTGLFTAVLHRDLQVPMGSYVLPRQLSRILDLDGPVENIEAECTSSHLATIRARSCLKDDRCSTAVVAGICLRLAPPHYLFIVADTFRSTSGICRPLDEDCDGGIRSEGCAAIVLQIQPDADCSAAIHGANSTLSSNRLSSLESPDSVAQYNAFSAALAESVTQPSEVGASHIHGIGQKIADSSEILALRKAFKSTNAVHQMTLLNHKANFGHTTAASGILALIAAVIALKQLLGVPNLRFSRPLKAVQDAAELVVVNSSSATLSAQQSVVFVTGHASSGINVGIVVAAETAKQSQEYGTRLAVNYSHSIFEWAVEQHPSVSCSENSLMKQLQKSPHRIEQLGQLVTNCVFEISELEVGADEPLLDAGLDSLAAVELRTKLSASLDGEIVLTVGLLFDFPTIQDIVDHLDSQFDLSEPPVSQMEIELQDCLSASDFEHVMTIISRTRRLPPQTLTLEEEIGQLEAQLQIHITAQDFEQAILTRERIKALQPPAPVLRPPVTASAFVSEGKVCNTNQYSVLGVGCLLPGRSKVTQAWQLLISAQDLQCGVPAGRWDEAAYAEADTDAPMGAKCYTQSAGYIPQLEAFDSTFFRIAAAEAKQMDPQQRLSLEVCCSLGICQHCCNCCNFHLLTS